MFVGMDVHKDTIDIAVAEGGRPRCGRGDATPSAFSVLAQVLAEFTDNPSGLVLPPGKVVQAYDGQRIGRVLWKIVRGLHSPPRDLVRWRGPLGGSAAGSLLAIPGNF
jgi:hypothetical protein